MIELKCELCAVCWDEWNNMLKLASELAQIARTDWHRRARVFVDIDTWSSKCEQQPIEKSNNNHNCRRIAACITRFYVWTRFLWSFFSFFFSFSLPGTGMVKWSGAHICKITWACFRFTRKHLHSIETAIFLFCTCFWWRENWTGRNVCDGTVDQCLAHSSARVVCLAFCSVL